MKYGNQFLRILIKVLLIVIGNTIYEAGVVLFILPTGLITGGTTGIALIVNHFAGLPISIFIAIFNVIMFAVGYFVLGRNFAMSTLVSTLSYPLMLGVIQKMVGDLVLTDDLLLSALFGGLCIGLALAIVIRIGASTGGMDIPPLFFQTTLGIPVSVSMYAFDFAILIGQMLFTPRETCLYGILLVLVYTVALDKLLAVGESNIKLEIVTNRQEELKEAIQAELDRSVTMLHGRTGYMSKETDVLFCVVAPRELHKLEKIVYSIDSDAFFVMVRATSVHGRGFSSSKEYFRNR